MTKLERLLESLDPDRTLEDAAARIDRAVNSFHIKSGSITKWEDFKACLVEFFCHLENTVLELAPPRAIHPQIDWGRCCRLLMEEYGKSAGEKAAFEIARTGGVYAVLKALAMRLAAQYTGNEVSARISSYWNGLTVEEKLAAPEEYLRKFGHLLPPEITEGGGLRVHARFPKVLEEHPRLIQRLRRVGK